MDKKFAEILIRIIHDILSNRASHESVRLQIQNELESRNIWDSDCFMITDCYYTLKHMDEEEVTAAELEYFEECLSQKREYSLNEKSEYVKNKSRQIKENIQEEEICF